MQKGKQTHSYEARKWNFLQYWIVISELLKPACYVGIFMFKNTALAHILRENCVFFPIPG